MSIELEQTPALVVIDLQTGILGQPTAHPVEQVVARSAELAASFRANGLPVVLVNVAGTAPGRTDRGKAMGRVGAQTLPAQATELLPELDRQPGDITVTKRTLGAFLSTDLDAQLKAAGVTQIVLTGVSTTSGVESTARSAYELGYHVAFVTDAMSDVLEAHEASIAYQFPKLGELGTTAEVLALLAER
ncbi:isochorismatase family protein [Leifsonia shinshuensis]|uniref:Nicotinamidase-related amidase n=1 Tax=Leifsonia shinshuensis TaxID=150026 RepID=A0A853CTU3_9MICO|nr:isochorismatase family protein [Leifsonia shinshuensis]NYJ22240.1 nicotinamidase-related amidase [Leifsonia shinshuensis]